MRSTSPDAANRLRDLIADGDTVEADAAMGETDCPEGCIVEPDGCCPHGWFSAARSAGLI